MCSCHRKLYLYISILLVFLISNLFNKKVWWGTYIYRILQCKLYVKNELLILWEENCKNFAYSISASWLGTCSNKKYATRSCYLLLTSSCKQQLFLSICLIFNWLITSPPRRRLSSCLSVLLPYTNKFVQVAVKDKERVNMANLFAQSANAPAQRVLD